MIQMTKNLVTGGAGFIGSNIVEALVERGDEVKVVDNFHTGSKENIVSVAGEIELIRSPCADIPEMDFEELEYIFHLGIPSSSPMYRENPLLVGKAINEFINIMELALQTGAKVVFASTSSMYGTCDPPHREDLETEAFDYYTEARISMERLAKVYNELYGVSSAGMRFFSVYGPHEEAKGKYANIITQFYWKIKDDERPVIYGDGEQKRDFTHVSDVVKACLKAAGRNMGSEAINVGTGRETTFNEVVELINEKLGKSIKPKYTENPIENYVSRTLADLTKARRLLDYEPSIGLEKGIEKMTEQDR